MDEIETSYTQEIVCPYCGYEFNNSWEVGVNEQSIGEIDCPECGKAFLAYRNIEVTYNSWTKEHEATLKELMHDVSARNVEVAP